MAKANSSLLKAYAFRLRPKADLRKSIMEFAGENHIRAGSIVSCVGSLEQIHLRFANQETGEKKKGFFEILALAGTFSDSACHLHLAVADREGKVLGGHLLNDNLVYTTAELVIADLPALEFGREVDETYGYYELIIHHRKSTDHAVD